VDIHNIQRTRKPSYAKVSAGDKVTAIVITIWRCPLHFIADATAAKSKD